MANLGEFGAAIADADPNYTPDTFTLYGETFTVKRQVGAFPLLRFAYIAKTGAEAEEIEGLAAMYRLITSCVVKEDVERFEKVADEHDADIPLLMQICMTLYQAVTGRPTEPLTDSAATSSTTTEKSREPLSSDESLSPIQRDPRVLALQSVESAALQLVG